MKINIKVVQNLHFLRSDQNYINIVYYKGVSASDTIINTYKTHWLQ